MIALSAFRNATILLICLFIDSSFATACEMCNCYLGIQPGYNQHAIGVNYRYREFKGPHVHGNADGHDHHHETAEVPEVHEVYNTIDFNGRIYPAAKLQLLFNFPYSINYNLEDGRQVGAVSGMGDAFLMGMYQLFNSGMDSTRLRHRMFVGAGVKAPTGIYDEMINGELDQHRQPGTGSWDVMTGVSYIAKYNKAGLSADVIYKINSVNPQGYRFANRLNLNTSLFYSLNYGSWVFLPNAGFFIEQAGEDSQDGVPQDNTGGVILMGGAGMDIYFGRMALRFTGQLPVAQEWNGLQPDNKFRVITGLQFVF